MVRHLPMALISLAALAGSVRADGPAPAPAAPAAPAAAAPLPALASDEDAAKAVAAFKEAWKAKGLKGDERMSQRDWAMDELSKVQHPLVVSELGSVARSGEDDLRLMAVIYLARAKALPGPAGEQALQAIQKFPKDVPLLLSALQTLGKLKYLGADDTLKGLLKSEDWAVRKCAISTIGLVGDMRLLEDLLKILGIDIKNAPPAGDEKKGGKEVVEEGYSYDGAEAAVDTGAADDSDQKAAEKQVADQIAKNKAAAGASGGSGAAGGAGGSGSSGGRGGSSRSPTELRPYVLKSLKSLTGETFMNSREIFAWLRKSAATVETKKQECDATEAAQKAQPKK